MKLHMYNEKKRTVDEEQYNTIKTNMMEGWGEDQFEYSLIRELPFVTDTKTQTDEEIQFAIRMNQLQGDEIYVIKKAFWDNVVYETKEKISKEECTRILNADLLWLIDSGKPVLMELYMQIALNQLYPSKIVEYVQERCEKDEGKEVVVFDSSIKTAKNKVKDFFRYDLSYEIQDKKDKPESIILSIIKNIKVPNMFNNVIQASF